MKSVHLHYDSSTCWHGPHVLALPQSDSFCKYRLVLFIFLFYITDLSSYFNLYLASYVPSYKIISLWIGLRIELIFNIVPA